MATLASRNPYVGPRSIEEGEPIFGRDHELAELRDLLIAERIVLLYSPSGAGKSSLIQAALIPQLRKRRFHVLPLLRVGNSVSESLPADANRYSFSALLSMEGNKPPAVQLPVEQLARLDLATYLDLHSTADDPEDEVLIFDQFEEVLALDPTDTAAKAAFFTGLGEALRNERRWALFALREDYLAGLDPYRDTLPGGVTASFRLDLLDRPAALQAIQAPAQAAGVEFASAAAERLVDDLRRVLVQRADGSSQEQEGPYVEPVQLQVVCRQIWEQRMAGANQIGSAEVSAVGSVDDALAAYYAQEVHKVESQTGVPERVIREWFTGQLITLQGIRGQVLRAQGQSAGLDNRVIAALVETHLVRAEERRGAMWFELAHDRLLAPVQASNTAWFEAHLSILQRQAALWNEKGRPASLLLRDDALREAAEWAGEHEDKILKLDSEFLQISREHEYTAQREQRLRELEVQQALTDEQQRSAAAQAVAREQGARAEAQARATSQLRWFTFILAALLIITAVALVFAWRANDAAKQEEATAVAARGQAINQTWRLIASQARILNATQPDVSLLLSVEANKTLDTIETRGTLLGGLLSESRVEKYLRGHQTVVNSVAFSPDGKSLASAGNGGNIILWDLASQKPVGQLLTTRPSYLLSIAFSQDGKLLVSARGDRTIILWDVVSRKPIGQPLRGHTDSMTSVAFSPDGKTLASASADRTIILWDVATRKPIGPPLTSHKDIVYSVAFSPDGKTFASASADRTIILWDVASRKPIGPPLSRHTGGVRRVAFSPDGKTLASASDDGTVILWDVTSQKPIGQPLTGHTDGVHSVAFSPDGKTLASAGQDNNIILWDVASRKPIGQPLTGHTGIVTSVAFSPDGKTLASASSDTTIILWNLASQTSIGQSLSGHTDTVFSVAFSPDGKTLVSAGYDDYIILWGVASRKLIGQPPSGHAAGVLSVAFSPDGKTLASAGQDNNIILWDVASRKPIGQPLTGHRDDVRRVAFSPDGKTLASASADRTIILWDVATRKPIGPPLTSHTGIVNSVAFSPDGKTLASASADRTIILWDVATRKPIGPPLSRHRFDVLSVAFSPDGKTLASASSDQMIILWDVASQKPIGQPLTGHKSIVTSVAFSPDGKTLASASYDRTIILWDVTSQKPIGQPLTGHKSIVTSVAFSPDGKTLASASTDTSIILWDVSVESWRAHACNIANRNLSLTEWTEFIGPDTPYRRSCSDLPDGEGVPISVTATARSEGVLSLEEFRDVDNSAYFYGPIKYLAGRGVISGYADGSYRPYSATTRGQLSKILVLAEGWTIVAGATPHFVDTLQDSPFYQYVETAWWHGVISGYSDASFRWQEPVTRGQLSKMVMLAQGWQPNQEVKAHFTDVPADNPFYSYIEADYTKGIITGYGDGTFRPGNSATRGQVAKIVYQLLISH